MLLHPERSSRWIAGGCFDGWASCPSNSGVWIQVKLLPSHCLRSDEPRRSPRSSSGRWPGLSSSGCLIGWAWQDTGILAAGVRGRSGEGCP